jgi:hypothetical protein
MINGWHPEYGSRSKDTTISWILKSAGLMPTTGNVEIDSKVLKAKRIKKLIKGT